ncbi:hypothetical protein PTE30175_03556 [Pandoraea terrae]|uniref:DUF6884 domain-containing protein n=1 Tax=Pandoraea terrae TaxID=1537710 RepID=A0A5E4X460_9BURK|nr:hypothetical protein PTE30175_03556 [Pandoraea terrae]
MNTVFLVSCVKQKRDGPSPAKLLYTSDWFHKARTYVDASGTWWFILSAEYRLLEPERHFAPYKKTLNRMSISELLQRRTWANKVINQLDAALPSADRIVMLAGVRYREFLIDYMLTRARTVEVPRQGFGIGQQLRWLKSANGQA